MAAASFHTHVMASAPLPSPAAVVELPLGHSLAIIRTDSGATLMLRAPGAQPDIELEVAITTSGATLRKRTWTGPPPPPSPSMLPPSVSGAVVSRALTTSREPHLSVQQYAALRAQCLSTEPGGLGEVRARYGLDEAGDLAEADAWRLKFAEDSALFETYRRLFQQFRSSLPPSAASIAPASSPRSKPAMSTAALTRILTLGEHATMSAELLFCAEETVYAKYDLADRKVRADVLRVCEQRLEDPTVMETWKKLRAIAVAKLEK